MANENEFQQPPQQPDQFYGSFDKDLYRITGQEETDDILDMVGSNPSANNSGSVTISGSDIGSGVSSGITQIATGGIESGKTTFDNSVSGFILGADPKDGNAKFYIGNASSYFNWDGINLTVTGTIAANSIAIPDIVTANSFHVDSSGNAWWGSTSLATAKAKVLNTGVAQFAQGSNSFSMVNSNGDTVLNMGSNRSIMFQVLPTHDDFGGMLIQNFAGLVSSSTMLEVDTQNASSNGTTVYVSQAGTGSGIQVIGLNNTVANYLVSIVGSTYQRNLLEITSAYASNSTNIMVHINKTAAGVGDLLKIDNAGTGYAININATNSSANGTVLVASTAGGRAVEIDNNDNTNANAPLYVSNANTTVAPINSFGAAVSTHFHRVIIGGGGHTLWDSDGTTPQSNLSGTAGDFCIGGPSGHPFYCTGTTSWTQI